MTDQIQKTITRGHKAKFSGDTTIPTAVMWQIYEALALAKGDLGNYARLLGVEPRTLTTHVLTSAAYDALATAIQKGRR